MGLEGLFLWGMVLKVSNEQVSASQKHTIPGTDGHPYGQRDGNGYGLNEQKAWAAISPLPVAPKGQGKDTLPGSKSFRCYFSCCTSSASPALRTETSQVPNSLYEEKKSHTWVGAWHCVENWNDKCNALLPDDVYYC